MYSLESSLPAELYSVLVAHFERTQEYFSGLGSLVPDAVILGGGYGRCEGGVTYSESGVATLFNDLDYFIFCSSPDHPELLAAVKQWEAVETEILGIDVEGKCLPRSDLGQVSHSMMFYDLVAGHRVVMGPENYLEDFVAQLDATSIATIEATRLLWNRGSGLLFAKADLEASQNADLIHRNQSKAKLAIGDAWLTVRGGYQSLASERNQALHASAVVDSAVVTLHDEGLAFKRRPTEAPSMDVLRSTQDLLESVWLMHFLDVESTRLDRDFADAASYAAYRHKLYPESKVLRNFLLGIRDRLKRGGGIYPIWDYPRGALQRALVLLLSENDSRERIAQALGSTSVRMPDLIKTYRYWWGFYS